MISVLSGGTGTPKLLQGLKEIVNPEELNIIVNTVENNYFSGVYVTPDIDTVLYTMSDLINSDTWYGLKNDTFITNETLRDLGSPELLRIGDKDRALKIQKTLLLKEHSLTEAVDIQAKNLGLKSKIRPMSDEQSYINIETSEGVISFHEFLITKRGEVDVLDVEYNTVNPAPGLIESIEDSDIVIIGPSNPITSINPILIMDGVIDALKKTYVVSVSPIIGNAPVSGPAGKFMEAKNIPATSIGVCSMYSNFLNHFIIDDIDEDLAKEIKNLIETVTITKTKMKNIDDKINLAKTVMGEYL